MQVAGAKGFLDVRSSYKTIGLWVILIALFVCFYNIFSRQTEEVVEPSFTSLLTKIDEKKVRLVAVKGNTYSGTFEDTHEKFRTTGPAADGTMLKQLRDAGVEVKYEKEEQNSLWLTILGQWMPVLFLFVFFVIFMRQLQGTGGKAMTFGKSKAKLLSESHNKVTFADVAGIDECKDELEEIIAFLKDPKKFTKLGGRIPKGVLMMGPPGTGKTLLARPSPARRACRSSPSRGSDFVEMFVGVGASRVRDLFEQGKKNAPCIIFIDEIDAVGRHRGAGPRRRTRRARADPQPASGRDGRLRVERGRHPHRCHQPARRPRPGAAAAGALRPPHCGSAPGRQRSRSAS